MKPARVLTVAVCTVFSLVACESPPPVLRTQDSDLKVIRRDDYFAIVRFVDESTSKQRYGAEFNPFIAVPRPLTPRRFMVFRLTVEEVKLPILIRLNQVELAFGNQNAAPMDLHAMTRYWGSEDEATGIGPHEQARRDRLLRQELLPSELSVTAGGHVAGLLVFGANFPRYGEARLTVPLLDPKGDLVERLNFTFTF